jgi:hypothetical protein
MLLFLPEVVTYSEAEMTKLYIEYGDDMTEKDITGGANDQLKLTYLLFHPRAL